MLRRRTPTTTTRESALSVPPEVAWAVAASGRTGPHWYVESAPFVIRGGIDRVLGGEGRRWEPPGTPLLATGDRAGFWRVTEADHERRRLVLTADVRAPGTVSLTTEVTDGRLRQTVALEPRGLLGAAYLLADLGAREAVAELAHRRLLHEIRQTPTRA